MAGRTGLQLMLTFLSDCLLALGTAIFLSGVSGFDSHFRFL